MNASADNLAADPWPVELRLADGKTTLIISWDDGRADELAAEYLRVESPSAEVQGHRPDEKQTVSGKRDVTIRDVEAVGSYAVRLIFSDGHSTGIYTWPYLRKLADEREAIWGRYLDALAEKGLTRG